MFFFFIRMPAYELRISYVSSTLCSSDLHEVQIQVGVRPQCQELVVVFGWRDRGDGDIARLRFTGSDQAPRPPKSFDRLMVGGGSGDGLHRRSAERRGGKEWAHTCRTGR